MVKVLLTGANGFLGKSILQEISINNIVITLSRNVGDYKLLLENEIPYFNDYFEVVIHVAGKAHIVPKTEEERKDFYNVNVLGTENLLKGLEITGVPEQFVFISSVSVYGQETGNNITEEHPLLAKDAYGLSKIEAEKLILNWCKLNNVVCTILRLPLLVGKNPPGNLGTMLKAIRKGYYFNISGGKARKSMVLVQDVASIIMKVAPIGGIYNLTDGFHPSFNELRQGISQNKKRSLNLPINIAKILGKLGDLLGEKSPINSAKVKKITSDLTFNDSKARERLGWKPQEVLKYLENNTL